MDKLLKDKKLFILDMDGTIYLGETPIPGALEFTQKAAAKGKRVIYFTNNASKSIEMYYEKLNRLGFQPKEGDIMSSADVTIDYLKEHHKNQSVYLVGTPPLKNPFRTREFVFLTAKSPTLWWFLSIPR